MEMTKYIYNFVSRLNDDPIKINVSIFARDRENAERNFYFRLLDEFGPEDFATIISNIVENTCVVKQCKVPEDSIPGIANFTYEAQNSNEWSIGGYCFNGNNAYIFSGNEQANTIKLLSN